MFDIDRFVTDCDAAVIADGGAEAVREILRAAVMDDCKGIIAALGEPKRAGVQVLHRSPRLTVMKIVWPPSYTQTPHNHRLWAEIGVYCGREDNIFWRRCAPNTKWPITAMSAASVRAGECLSMRDDTIHSVTNPLDKVTAALHVYGGNLHAASRSMWDGETLIEGPLDHTRDVRAIEAYNTRLGAA